MTPADPARVLLWSHRLADVQTGIGRYVRELTAALAAGNGSDWPDLRYELCAGPEDEEVGWAPANVPVNRLGSNRRALHLAWTAFQRPHIERFAGDSDLVHALLPAIPVPTRAPFVVTVHDLFPVDHPEWFPRLERLTFRRALDRAASHAARIVVDSRHIGDRLVTEHQIDRARIEVIPLGVSHRFFSSIDGAAQQRILERHSLVAGEYVIAVGAVNSRKNLSTAVEAISRVAPPITLVLAGPAGGGETAILAKAEQVSASDRVRLLGMVPDADLPALMKGALALVQPSLDEGFGFPPLEAMAVGTPSIVATSGSLPEVVGAAAIGADPYDAEEWAAAITDLQNDGDQRRKWVAAGAAWASRFTWDECARNVAALHRLLLDK